MERHRIRMRLCCLCRQQRRTGKTIFMGYTFCDINNTERKLPPTVEQAGMFIIESQSSTALVWFFWCVYVHITEYRPGRGKHGNVDFLSRLPLPATNTEAYNHPNLPLPGPADVDVYLVGKSGVHSSQLVASEPMDSSQASKFWKSWLDPEHTFSRRGRDEWGVRSEECTARHQRRVSSSLSGDPKRTDKEEVGHSRNAT